MTLDLLKQDLFERFIRAFDEFDRIAEKKARAQTFVYSQLSRYSIRKFDGKKIPAGGKTLSQPPEMNPKVYGLDAAGRPCYHSSEHSWNKEYWEGFYDLTDSCIEYIDFSLQSKMPIEISRMLFENGRKTGVQHFKINGGRLGNSYNGLSNREIAAQLQHARNDLISTVELYHYEGQRIVSADCWNAMPGIENTTYKQEYRYNTGGKLKEIIDVQPDGATQFAYADIPEGTSLKELSDQLAMQMATAIAETLEQTELPGPLAILCLGYQEYGGYNPVLTVVLQNKKDKAVKKLKGSDLLEELFVLATDFVALNHEKYERLFTAFIGKVMDDEQVELATAMIRKVAYILTTEKAFGKIPVSGDFFAYAVDWSMTPENDEVIRIFRECGMPEEQLEQWRARGIFGE